MFTAIVLMDVLESESLRLHDELSIYLQPFVTENFTAVAEENCRSISTMESHIIDMHLQGAVYYKTAVEKGDNKVGVVPNLRGDLFPLVAVVFLVFAIVVEPINRQ